MRTVAMWAFSWSLVAMGCGAGPIVRDEGVVLRLMPPRGARYEVALSLDMHEPERSLDLHTEARGTLEVVAVDETGLVLRSRMDRSEMAVLGTPVRLPPVVTAEPCEVELRVDGRGALIAAPVETSGRCPGLDLAVGWVVSVLPNRTVRVGDTWEAEPAFVVSGAQAFEATREGTVELLAIEDGEARLRWETTSVLGPLERAGLATSVTQRCVGTTSNALSDGLTRRGESHTTVSFEPSDAGRGWPDRIDVSWCLRGEGEPPCETASPAPDDRPRAQVYEGDACTARLEHLDATLRALPVELERATREEVPQIETGVSPITGLAPRIVVGSEGIELDGRTLSIEELARDLETLERNWGLLHPRSPYPARVHFLAAPSTPLSALEPVLALLASDTTVDLIVTTGLGPPRPGLPEWVGELPEADDARAAALSRALGAAIAGCPSAITLFGALANADAESRLALLREGLAEALTTCRCGGADIDALEALCAHVQSRNDAILGALVIPAGREGTPLRLRRIGTALDLATALSQRPVPAAPVRLQFR